MSEFLEIQNGDRAALSELPVLPFDMFRSQILDECSRGARLSALFGEPDGGALRVYAVLALDGEGVLRLAAADVRGAYESFTPALAQAHWFERELHEQWGVEPLNHPWLKPIRFQPACGDFGLGPAPGADAVAGNGAAAIAAAQTGRLPGVTDFYRVEGPEVHEVAVGPVHAGIIEPGHFRFQCHGEEVLHLEISLGYQHRGIERALRGVGHRAAMASIETVAGDTTVGHATAWCQNIEALAGIDTPARALALRGIALELERLANHTGDLGALAGDVGFLPTASYCGRLRGDFLNMTALLCGNRFSRGLLRPGGVAWDLEPQRAATLLERLAATLRDVEGAIDLLFAATSVLARFEDTGRLTPAECEALGLVGPAARACGADRDVRVHHPAGIWRFAQIPISTASTGDVLARARVRWQEIQRSAAFIREQAAELPSGALREPAPAALTPDSIAVSLCEGWRGEICHVVLTDERGGLRRVKIVDPSFHNWMGLAVALRGEQISDFPLCNKSFNLSYCGHDL